MNKGSSRELRTSIRRARRRRATELNLVSMIDVLTVLVFFLLVNSLSISSLGIKLPDASASATPPPHLLSVVIRASGLTLADNDRIVGRFSRLQDQYDLAGLSSTLRGIKDQAPQESGITLRLEAGIPYKTLIAVMDAVRSRDDGPRHSERALFPVISIGEALPPGRS